jgi:hypothetical protein
MEAGLKTAQVIFNNETAYFVDAFGNRIKDTRRTSTYKYNENISAAYVQLSKTISGITAKAGTRLERTSMNGHQLYTNRHFIYQ